MPSLEASDAAAPATKAAENARLFIIMIVLVWMLGVLDKNLSSAGKRRVFDIAVMFRAIEDAAAAIHRTATRAPALRRSSARRVGNADLPAMPLYRAARAGCFQTSKAENAVDERRRHPDHPAQIASHR
jgi:hypothetical protein